MADLDADLPPLIRSFWQASCRFLLMSYFHYAISVSPGGGPVEYRATCATTVVGRDD
jgi:hypothetical protein